MDTVIDMFLRSGVNGHIAKNRVPRRCLAQKPLAWSNAMKSSCSSSVKNCLIAVSDHHAYDAIAVQVVDLSHRSLDTKTAHSANSNVQITIGKQLYLQDEVP
jgi:hypothetical protein